MKKIFLIFAFLSLPFYLNALVIGEDGLYEQPWIIETFKDWSVEELSRSLKGCGYCKRMHEKVYSIREIATTLQDDFFVIRINIFGDLEVTDFDGETLPEKEIVKKWGVMFTPTVMFFPEEISGETIASEASVVTMPGAFAKGTTRLLLEWILLKGYEGEEHLQKFIARRLNNS